MTPPAAAPGREAPAFSGRTHHGAPIGSADLAGAPSALVFYPFAFSRVCGAELQGLRERRQQIEALGARVLAISCDTVHTLRAYAQELARGTETSSEDLGFTLVSDFWPHGRIAATYGCFDADHGAATRLTVVSDAQRRIVAVQQAALPEERDLDETLRALAQAAQ